MIARPFLVVEGRSDMDFWITVLRRHCPRARPTVRAAGGKPAMLREAATFVRQARQAGCPLTIFIVDQDKDASADDTAKRFREKLHRGAPVVVGVATRKLEAWALADERAVRAAFPQSRYRRAGETEKLGNPERDLDRYVRRHFSPHAVKYEKTIHVPNIAEHFDLKRAQQGSRSLRAFVTDLKKAQKRPRR